MPVGELEGWIYGGVGFGVLADRVHWGTEIVVACLLSVSTSLTLSHIPRTGEDA